VVSAYILGTITVLVVRADEWTKEYRSAMGDLQTYGHMHKIPVVRSIGGSHLCTCCRPHHAACLLQRLLEVMRTHLEVTMHETKGSTDEAILSVHSGIVRRRVLRCEPSGHATLSAVNAAGLLLSCRHLYLGCLERCYLFKGCPPKMLNAVLTNARVDRYLPQV
jgi:hypothetical protein